MTTDGFTRPAWDDSVVYVSALEYTPSRSGRGVLAAALAVTVLHNVIHSCTLPYSLHNPLAVLERHLFSFNEYERDTVNETKGALLAPSDSSYLALVPCLRGHIALLQNKFSHSYVYDLHRSQVWEPHH